MNKKLLVITPFYNAEKYLQGAIESTLQQTYKNIELVFIRHKFRCDGSPGLGNYYEVVRTVL